MIRGVVPTVDYNHNLHSAKFTLVDKNPVDPAMERSMEKYVTGKPPSNLIEIQCFYGVRLNNKV